MSTTAMINSHPNSTAGLSVDLLAEAIDAAAVCATTCTNCADACLAEESVADLRNCLRTNLDCADVCAAAASVLSRRTGSNVSTVKEMLTSCVTACADCADECEGHAGMHEHCRVCAEVCRRCEKACADLLTAIG